MLVKNLIDFLSLFAIVCFFSCRPSLDSSVKTKNEVLVLGTIHGGHLTDSVYNIAYLEKLLVEINPDFILAEIPPDRMKEAMDGFLRDDTLSEPRAVSYTHLTLPTTPYV